MFLVTAFFIFALRTFSQLRVQQPFENKEWDEHKSKFNLKFSIDEDSYRKEIFIKNLRFIMESNSRNINLTLKMNKFGHLEKNERPRLLDLKKPLGFYEDEDPIFVGEEIPLDYDWREYGAVSAVQNQLPCGSCYGYSAVGAVESQFAIHHGVLPDLSVQEIVDCSVSYGNDACDGGYPERVYQYCIDNGLSTYNDYPYEARQGYCRRNNPNSSYKLIGYRGLRGGDEDNLLRAIYYIGPISIVMDAAHEEFYFYDSGIIDISLCNPNDMNHAVLAVGYNLNETPYLLVKNSYGSIWGMGGYFKIALHKNNMCGITTWATYPIIAA